MDGDLGSDDDERGIELSSIAAIFPELVIGSDPFTASLELPISPSRPLLVVFPQLTSNAPASQIAERLEHVSLQEKLELHGPPVSNVTAMLMEVKEISHLPPLKIDIQLPQDYPSTSPPVIHLSSELSWIPETRLRTLETEAKALWEELGHNQVLYDYIDLLQQAADDGFDLVPKDGSAVTFPATLEVALLDYDLKMKRRKFEESTFDCGVCLEPKKGTACYRLQDCNHVFCVECLQSFYSNCITEGDVYSVKCLAPDCERKPTLESKRQRLTKTLEASELIQIPIPQEQVQRYVMLLRKKRLESNSNTIYCPRKWCQGPARSSKPVNKDETEDIESIETPADESDKKKALPLPSERLCVCEDCGFAFCCVCTQGWHGEFAPCFPRSQYELTTEELASEAYLRKHSQLCPTCRARCQKTMGCNHMECFQCKTHFCYLCRAFLDQENPYKHFNTPLLQCYMQLWVMEEGDGDPGDVNLHPVADDQFVQPEDDNLPQAAPPPPAPAPPAPALGHLDDVPHVRYNRRAQRGLARPQALQGHAHGLQRFLAMAAADEEDGWDSDELDDDDDDDEDDI
ncbi:MAG: hypothetical protein GOMPHAMPRED_001109 [Gomphillus americanus]|uniref:RBR-type E3 ubiquitin transferase n=1 Tax=Gomphillus americanus TaxID=1940652 RepID=A0A8H3F694_9LECA|nr:MAG: hypothetical protein GOMPHAMPRED_001109 [Gomphillus americanus]